MKLTTANKTFKTLGIFYVVLGLIHLISTPFILGNFKQMGKYDLLTFIFMFVATGAALVLASLTILKANRLLLKLPGQSLSVMLFPVLFITLLGIGSVATMPLNLFAWLSFLPAVFLIVVYVSARKTGNQLISTSKN